jgi:hypothetical protein
MTGTDYQRDRACRLGELASRASDPEHKRYLLGLAAEAARHADTMEREAVAKPDKAASDPALIPLLRSYTAGLDAGDLAPAESFQVVAAAAASAYPTDIWLRMNASDRAAAIYSEMRKMDLARAARADEA